MKFLLPLLFTCVIIFSSCASSQIALKNDSRSPCNDSLYLALQEKDSSTFTANEKIYFSKMKIKCDSLTKKAELDDGKETVLWCLGLAAAGVAIMGLAGHFLKPH